VVYVQMEQQTIADYPVGGAATTPTFRYVYASYIDEPVVRKGPTSTSTVHFYHRNHQYSITAITTSTGTIAERYAYTAYGQPTILDASASVLSSSAINNRYTYTAREWDATLGLHHFRARWMSPIAGRFLGRDPIQYNGLSWNQYQALSSNPLDRFDPSGLRDICCTFDSWGAIWSETIDCDGGTPVSCCSDYGSGYLWNWDVWGAREGECSLPPPPIDPCEGEPWKDAPGDWLDCISACLSCQDDATSKVGRTAVGVVGGWRVKKEYAVRTETRKITHTNWLAKKCQKAEKRVASKTINSARLVGRVCLYYVIVEGAFSWSNIAKCQMDCSRKANLDGPMNGPVGYLPCAGKQPRCSTWQ